MKGQQTFTQQENLGRGLFNGAGRCNQCHGTDAHISNGVHNIGLDLSSDPTVQPGVDVGAGDGRFNMPSLRNIAVRGKFMHDGRFSSLAEVVQFYVNGVQDNPNLDPILRTPGGQVLQLPFTEANVNQIIAFLNTLTDQTFLSSSLFSDPFVTLPGDYTGDGIVNQADYDLCASTSAIPLRSGRWQRQQRRGCRRLRRVAQNLGRTWLDLATGASSSPLPNSVPEPAGACASRSSPLYAA